MDVIGIVLTEAARNGHLNIVNWAVDHRCQFHKDACHIATQEGNLRILMKLRDSGCEWDKNVCLVGHSNLSIDDYLRSRNCPCGKFNSSTMATSTYLDF